MTTRGRKPKQWRDRLEARKGAPEIALTKEGFAARTGWKSDRIRLSSRTRDAVVYELRKRLVKRLLREDREALVVALLKKDLRWGQLEVAAEKGTAALDELALSVGAMRVDAARAGFIRQYKAVAGPQRDRMLKNFVAFLTAELKRPPVVTDITTARVKKFLDELAVTARYKTRGGTAVAPGTRNANHGAISKLCEWCIEHGLLVANPAKRVKRAAPNQPLMPVMQPWQVAKYIEGVSEQDPDPLLRRSTFLWCLVATGADVGELETLTPAQIHFGAGQALTKITFQRTKTRTKPRSVPVGDAALVARLRAIIAGSKVKANQPIFAGVTRKMLSATHRAGRIAAEAGPDITRKALRHIAAQMWRRAGADLQRVKDWLGHASIAQTVIYTDFGPDQPTEEVWALGAAELYGSVARSDLGPDRAPSKSLRAVR